MWENVKKSGYPCTKRQIFRLVQIENICRQQNRCNFKTKIHFGKIENIAGKGENAG